MRLSAGRVWVMLRGMSQSTQSRQSTSQSARLGAVIEAIETLSPPALAEPWDKTGLQVGDPAQAVSRALLCIDLTEPVVAEAARRKAELIVAYHPVIFSPLTRLTAEHWKPRLLAEVVRKGIAVYCPHTALDAVAGGLNDWLAEGLGAGARRPIRPTATAEARGDYKLVTFVPPDVADAVRDALSRAGAGVIGHYSRCSFGLLGHGTFEGDETTNPAVGEAGRLERVEELRMEMVVPRAKLVAVVEALHASHPYEEPAFDVYETVTPPELHSEASPEVPSQPRAHIPEAGVGAGRVLTLEKPVRVDALAQACKRRLGLAKLRVARPKGVREVRTVAVCVGAGGSLFEGVEADAYVTGEMRHHDVLDLVSRSKLVLLAGHTNTERPYLAVYRQRLAAAVKGAGLPAVTWTVSTADRCPWEER